MSKTDATKFPALKLYGDRVLSLLREYERSSRGKISVEAIDPRPDSDEESWAQKYGIQPLAMPTGESLYFGMAAVNARGNEEVIPVFSLSRQEFLEYDITKAIYSLNLETKPLVGIISSLKVEGETPPQTSMFAPSEPEPWIVVSQMSQFAQVTFIKPEEKTIDAGVKTLFVIHPKKLSPEMLYAIDQFVMRGGNLFVAIDPYCGADQPEGSQDPTAAMTYDHSSELSQLLDKWGVEMLPKKVVGDGSLSTKVNVNRQGVPQDFLLWLTLDKSNENAANTINKDDILTGQLNNVLLTWSGALKKKEVEGIRFQPLLQSTKDAQLFDENDYRFGGGSPEALQSKYVPSGEVQILAARVDGKFKSNFPEPPKGTEPNALNQQHLTESKGESHVIVVADVDFLTDRISTVAQNFLGQKVVTAINDNLAFAGNITENLLGSSDLISLRSRGEFSRPFSRVRAIEKKAEDKWRMEEMTLQAGLTGANQRLNQLQAGTDQKNGEQVLSAALMEEVKKIREQRADAQKRLREVRRNLRQDKESLGQWLFILNTFAVPLLLIVGFPLWFRRRKTSVGEN